MVLVMGAMKSKALRKLIGSLSSPSGCKVCGRPWDLCKAHYTPLSADRPDGSACFVLCEPCFADLNPYQRLLYYHELFALWLEGDGQSTAYYFRRGGDWEDRCKHTAKDWEMLRDAVLAGL